MRLIKYILALILAPYVAYAGVIYSTSFETGTGSGEMSTATRNLIIWDSSEDPDWRCAAYSSSCDYFSNIGKGSLINLSYSTHPLLGQFYLPAHRARTGSQSIIERSKNDEDRGQVYVSVDDSGPVQWGSARYVNGLSEFYMRGWNYYTGQDGTYDHATGAKNMRFYSDNGGSGVTVSRIEMIWAPTETGWRFVGNSTDTSGIAMYGGPVIPNNEWIGVECHIKLNTSGNSDGLYEVWIYDQDGDQIGYKSTTGVNFGISEVNDYKYNRFLVAGGWYSNSKANSYQYNYRYIDDVVISTTRIGAGETPPPVTTVTMTATDSSASEDGYTGQITLSCSGDNCNDTASVAVTRGGTATYGAGIDYTDTLSTPITSFPTTITLTPYDDSTSEAEETAIYTGVCTNCSLASSQATIYIADNDGTQTVTVTATDDVATEAGPTTGTFRVSRTGGTTGALSINFTMSGEATSGVDYTEISTITIATGDSYVDVTLTPIDDYNGDEPDIEDVTMTITAGTGYTVGTPSSAIITIEDNDEYPFGTGDIWGEHADSDHTGTATDTYLNSGAATTNYSQSGDIKLYTWPAGTNANTGIIKFDLSSVSTSTTIEAATLYLYMANYDGTETNPYSVSVHKIVNHDPTISEATWDVYSTGNNWTSGGGLSDIDTAESTTSIGTTIGTWYSWDVSDMVQDWITTPAANYGMLLKGAATQLVDEDRYFIGSFSGEIDKRPVVVITTGSGTSGEAGTSPPGGTGRISIGGSGRMNPK